ncbi:hypothetical protein EI77_01002 [Prosthecobacter fusiformis]|uniref:Uncharacterized protein n=1 Tax=Prosthecobacter fusiformis TaxID=48464 RepID=A0A4R7SR01_9BACT|nr:hypothetical protein [Prosthecobacter fusiformis]TDU81692.1 hypothetical protein EI77_01002 [Prosthecobacter fusiformis]
MNASFFKSASLAIVLGLSLVSPALAQETAEAAAPPAKAAAEKLRTDLLVPGVTLAEGVSEITGVAISPLLGMSALGAWKYYHTEEKLRDRLPWYCHPYAWGTGLALIGLCLLKDFLGAAAPALVKKPLDFAELFEDKLSALVASAAFVPLVALAMSHLERIPSQASDGVAASGLAVMPMASALDASLHSPWITIPLAIFAFGVVWLSSHAINVLIALSPFGIVDAGLKLIKLALLTLVTGTAALIPTTPVPALIVCGSLFLLGLLLAGWSFRLSIFGTLMGRDFLLNKRAQGEDLDTGVQGFLARRTTGVPVRTFGRMQLDETGAAHFSYRPWLLLPRRRIALVGAGMVVCRGLLHPSVAHRTTGETRPRSSLILLPRYRRLEESIAVRFGCQEVMDSTLMRGFKAMRMWLTTTLTPSRWYRVERIETA